MMCAMPSLTDVSRNLSSRGAWGRAQRCVCPFSVVKHRSHLFSSSASLLSRCSRTRSSSAMRALLPTPQHKQPTPRTRKGLLYAALMCGMNAMCACACRALKAVGAIVPKNFNDFVACIRAEFNRLVSVRPPFPCVCVCACVRDGLSVVGLLWCDRAYP